MPEKKKLFFENIKEDQLELIINRLKTFIESENSRFFYFSGVIGVGKTSFIRMMLRTLVYLTMADAEDCCAGCTVAKRGQLEPGLSSPLLLGEHPSRTGQPRAAQREKLNR